MNTAHMFEVYHKMSPNFMTPKILKFHLVSNRIIELSVGLGMNNEPIWGVTELVYSGSALNSTGNGKLFYSPKEARHFYQLLVNNK